MGENAEIGNRKFSKRMYKLAHYGRHMPHLIVRRTRPQNDDPWIVTEASPPPSPNRRQSGSAASSPSSSRRRSGSAASSPSSGRRRSGSAASSPSPSRRRTGSAATSPSSAPSRSPSLSSSTATSGTSSPHGRKRRTPSPGSPSKRMKLDPEDIVTFDFESDDDESGPSIVYKGRPPTLVEVLKAISEQLKKQQNNKE